jgi:hypothetical protein
VNTDWSPGVLLAALALLVLPILAMLALHWDSYPDDDRPRRNLSYGLAYMPGIFPPETEADHREMYFSGGVSMCRTKGVERVAEELQTDANPVDAAKAYATSSNHGYKDESTRRVVFEGCLRGFKQRQP